MEFLLENIAINTVISCGVTSASTTVTMSSTTGLAAGMSARSTNIAAGTTIVSIDSATEITISAAASGTATENVTFYTPVKAQGQDLVLAVVATSFGSGTVTIEGSPDGGVSWITLLKARNGSAATFTANAFAILDRIAQGYTVRAKLTGATNPSGVTVTLGN